jgi:hypothetical protein
MNGMRNATDRFMKYPIVPISLAGWAMLSPVKADTPALKEVPASLTIYVPTRNAKLERCKVQGKLYNFMPTALTTYASVVAEKALPLMFEKARTRFPKGTKLIKFPEIKAEHSGRNVMFVSLSEEILHRGFWKSKHQTLTAVYAIVNTAANDYEGGNSLFVKLLINGKPIRNLANVDLRKPLHPRMDLVSEHKGKSAHQYLSSFETVA